MHRVILVLLLSAACNNAMAEWVRVEGNEYVASYVDPATARKTGNNVQMLTLVDFKTVINNGGYARKSTKTLHEYDCKENQWRLLNFSYYSGNMGSGKLVYAENEPGQWVPIKPGSGTQARWKIACKK